MSIAGEYVREVNDSWDDNASDEMNVQAMDKVIERYAAQVVIFETQENENIWHYEDGSATHVGPFTCGIQVWIGSETEDD